MIRLKVKNNYFRVLDDYVVKSSSREVKFSSLKIDFTNKTIADLPVKYQEVQLLDLDNNYNINEVIYTGYVNNFVLPKMKNQIEYRELELDLLSPLAMATVRTADAVGTYNLQPLINELITPLLNDGFVLKEFNIGNNQITVNYLNETVESALNKLSNKFNFWWYIDKNKNIYINSIDYLITKTPKLIYDDDNKIDGLIDVIPSIDATDYCNVVNFTNIRLYTYSYFRRNESTDQSGETNIYYTMHNPITQIKYLNSGDEIEFDIPFDISIDNYYKNVENEQTDKIFQGFFTGQNITKQIDFDIQNNTLVLPNNVSIEEGYSTNKEFVFVRDVFFKNLIVGLKYNGSSTLTVSNISCTNALMWTKVKVINDDEVYRNKQIISETGIVEKIIDMNEQWKGYSEVIDIANSYVKTNISRVEQVKLNLDKNIDINIGDTIRINKPFFLINDTYIVTDKNISYNNNVMVWQYTLKNTNILENYVDLFRAKEQEEENQDKEYHLITSNYSEDTIKEVYEVVEL